MLYRRTASSRGIQNRLFFTGDLQTAELADLYRGAQCLVQASEIESFGFPTVEAMASGCPVVAVRSVAAAELVGDAALICGSSAAEIAAALTRVLTDDVLRTRLVTQGLERSATFSWDSYAAALQELIYA